MGMNEAISEMMQHNAECCTPFGMSNVHQMQSAPTVSQIEPTEHMIEQKMYVIRPLNARDIFPMTKIIRKIGLKDFGKCFEPEEINAITEKFSAMENIDDIADAVGVSVILKIVDIILEHIPDAGEEVFVFVGGLIGKTGEEVAALPMDVFFDLIVDVFQRKEFVGFMRAVSRLVK